MIGYAVSSSAAPSQDGLAEWEVIYNSLNSQNDTAIAVAADPTGGVVVTGTSTEMNDGFDTSYEDFVTIKYDAEGNQIWLARYDKGGPLAQQVRAVAVDSSGNAYVAGGASSLTAGYNYLTVKYDASGNELWTKEYRGDGIGDDWVLFLAVHPLGGVVAAGWSYGDGTGHDITTIRYLDDGTEDWVARYDGTGHGIDQPTALVTAPDGTVYLSGTAYEGTEDDMVVIAYDPDGQTRWIYHAGASYGESSGGGLEIGTDGSLYCAINRENDFIIVKLNTGGEEQWSASHDGTEVDRLLINADDYITAVGRTPGDWTDSDILLLRFAPDGNESWATTYASPFSGDHSCLSAGLDGNDNLYLTAYVRENIPSSQTGSAIYTLKYDTAGSLLWVSRRNNASSVETRLALVMDADDNAYVIGSDEPYLTSGADDYLTMKFAPDATCAGCMIDMICYADQDTNPANDCLMCDVAISGDAWTPLDGTACNDSLWCNGSDICQSGECLIHSGDPCPLDNCYEDFDCCGCDNEDDDLDDDDEDDDNDQGTDDTIGHETPQDNAASGADDNDGGGCCG